MAKSVPQFKVMNYYIMQATFHLLLKLFNKPKTELRHGLSIIYVFYFKNFFFLNKTDHKFESL